MQALRAEPFVAADVQAAMRLREVQDQRLLHGEVGALYPVLRSQQRVRDVFVNLLLAICETNVRYEAFVAADAEIQTTRGQGERRLTVEWAAWDARPCTGNARRLSSGLGRPGLGELAVPGRGLLPALVTVSHFPSPSPVAAGGTGVDAQTAAPLLLF